MTYIITNINLFHLYFAIDSRDEIKNSFRCRVIGEGNGIELVSAFRYANKISYSLSMLA